MARREGSFLDDGVADMAEAFVVDGAGAAVSAGETFTCPGFREGLARPGSQSCQHRARG